MELSNVSVAVLAGGFGTRLRSVVADRPKVLAQIRSQPFLTYLLDQIAAAGCRSVVLCTGYLGEQIESTFGKNYGPLRLIYSREQEPLGTAGALKLAITRFESDPAGDEWRFVLRDRHQSLLELALPMSSHGEYGIDRVARSERFGRVRLDADAKVELAEKKETDGAAWINAGICFLNQEVLRAIPRVQASRWNEKFSRVGWPRSLWLLKFSFISRYRDTGGLCRG